MSSYDRRIKENLENNTYANQVRYEWKRALEKIRARERLMDEYEAQRWLRDQVKNSRR